MPRARREIGWSV